MGILITIIAYLWASPWTVFGMTLGLIGFATGGGMQRVGRVFEFHGGAIIWFLRFAPFVAGAAAITFGHTVLARTHHDLEATREHEAIHVRQYERWGPFFIPCYLGWSLFLKMRGKHPYWDNPFEREAYDKAG